MSFGGALSLYTLSSLNVVSKNHRDLSLKIISDDLATANLIGSSFGFVESQHLKTIRELQMNLPSCQSGSITFSWPISVVHIAPLSAQDEAHGRTGAGWEGCFSFVKWRRITCNLKQINFLRKCGCWGSKIRFPGSYPCAQIPLSLQVPLRDQISLSVNWLRLPHNENILL